MESSGMEFSDDIKQKYFKRKRDSDEDLKQENESNKLQKKSELTTDLRGMTKNLKNLKINLIRQNKLKLPHNVQQRLLYSIISNKPPADFERYLHART
jgi:hypothetical protein